MARNRYRGQRRREVCAAASHPRRPLPGRSNYTKYDFSVILAAGVPRSFYSMPLRRGAHFLAAAGIA